MNITVDGEPSEAFAGIPPLAKLHWRSNAIGVRSQRMLRLFGREVSRLLHPQTGASSEYPLLFVNGAFTFT
jgi:hypothetical protein